MSRVQLPTQEYAAYIFDLDGTLVDSMPTHLKAWDEALAEVGLPPFIVSEFYLWGGRSAVDIVQELAQRAGRKDIDPHRIAVLKRQRYMALLEETPASPITEVVDFVRTHLGKTPMAIATGSAREGALKTLKGAGLEGVFSLIVTPQEVSQGKPAPDIFLKAAELLGVEAQACCVFEDAEAGIQAAKAAGMDVIVVSSAPSPPCL